MKRSQSLRAASMLCTLTSALAGCGSQGLMAPVDEVRSIGGRPALSFDEYMARHVEPREGGGYMVERDIHMSTLEMVREHWQSTTATTGAVAVHRSGGKDDVWAGTERLNITWCIRQSDFGTDANRVIDMLQKAASGWENAADVHWVHATAQDGSSCTRTNNSVKYNIERNFAWGSGLKAGMGWPSFARSDRFLELGRTYEWTDAELLAVMTHELGHSLGFVHEHDTASGCNYVTDNNYPYRQLTCYDGRGAMHYPDKPGWLDYPGHLLNFITWWDIEGAQALYGAPTNVINLANGTVFARKRTTGDIYKYAGGGGWTKIGGPGQAFVAVGNTLYGQTPGGNGSPVKWTGSGWVYIGGPAGQIFPCLGTLCATVPGNGNLAKYDAAANQWTIIGGAGSRFASSSTQLFGIGPWQDDYVARYTGSSWVIAGDGGSELFGGGTNMYRLTNEKDAIQRYNSDGSWTTIGGAGRQFLATGGNVYGLRPDGSWIMKYTGANWTSIHGPSTRIYGSSGALLTLNPSDDTVEQYNVANNTWTNLGKP